MLNVLRTSEIEFLDLVPSMAEVDGLNLDTHDMLKGPPTSVVIFTQHAH